MKLSPAKPTVKPTETAYQMGKAAFARGAKCIPMMDRDFMNFLKNAGMEVTLMHAWMQGFTVANLAAPVPSAA